jgi:NitT/TauT family transport system substrate-binding protein
MPERLVSRYSLTQEKKVAAAQLHQPYAAGLEALGVGRMLLMQNMPPLQDDYCCSVIATQKLVRDDRAKAVAVTRALLRGARWIRAHPVESAQLEIDAKHVSANAVDNQRAMASLDFFPSVEIAGRNTLDVLQRFKRLGFLDAAVDENSGIYILDIISEKTHISVKELAYDRDFRSYRSYLH